jgi:hypothetical protein
MRVLQAAALTAAALLLNSVASAQGLGDAATAAREKRKVEPAKPTKVYTDTDIGQSMTPVTTTRDLPATAEPAAAGGTPASGGGAPVAGQPTAEGQAPAEGGTPAEGTAAKASEDQARAEAEAQEKVADAWRKQLDQARKEEAVYKDIIGRVQLQLNGSSDFYSAAHAANLAFLEENKQKLAAAQAKVATLEQEGARNHYR